MTPSLMNRRLNFLIPERHGLEPLLLERFRFRPIVPIQSEPSEPPIAVPWQLSPA